jgi:tryptophanyl-tRNA synthetase
MGLLQRCHSFKDKVAQGVVPSHGLFAYPVLMAADILIVDADLVPVGKDQKQHLEVTRDVATNFHTTYDQDVFTLPEPLILDEVAVVPGVDGRKMSKSYGNTIDLFGPEKATRKRIMSIVTDSTPVEEPKDPDKCNLFAIISLFLTEGEKAELADRYRRGGLKYSEVKEKLLSLIWDFFAEPREKRERLQSNPDQIRDILRAGAEKARRKGLPTLEMVRKKVGLAY